MSHQAWLKDVAVIDLAAVELDYEGFRAMAQNPHLSAHEKIGFPNAYREGLEDAILDDILSKLPSLRAERGLAVLDIGPGCGPLARKLIGLCTERDHRLTLTDSPEMLALLPDAPGVTQPCPGPFPNNLAAVRESLQGQADAILCYSVLQYLHLQASLVDVVDAVVELLAPGGRALFGDVPNASKRRRFFASAAGQAHHRAFTGSDDPPPVDSDTPVRGRIDDAVLCGLMQQAQAAGCDAYLLPQGAALPMANRRDDLLLIKP